MKKMWLILLQLTLSAVAAYGGYLWGWHEGQSYHAVISGLSEANANLSAARSLRASDPDLALELLESNLSWVDTSLQFEALDLPKDQRGNYDIVMERLESYKRAYSTHSSR